ncbi:protein transport protein Sec31A-like [Uloborus diversus]|uniref:protein transport protein Sec31A-like n=1 Tax=Uloborus diversus TaxID=327109 RepID=UPI002409B9EF|nr:protein transport protein Sec31A-like [Uloborus diversus]
MKVKEIDRMANIAWSPAAHNPIYLAAGTAAQQLDATFSTTAALEIYGLNLTEPGLDMSMKGSVVSDSRFHKIVWGCEGMKTSDVSSGVIVGGADGGNIMIYDAAKLIQGDSAILHHTTKHTGPVHSLDFNKFQDCLLASGATESEIFIWDLNNPVSPVTLGAKSQPPEDVTCVAWNCQVQHILASTFPARCVVWDLRKNEPIIKVSDSSFRLRCKVVAWHPEVATQLCLASEDDHSPVIQLWDLRFATSPLKTLEHHQRGVLSIAWCPQDPDLLLSCGKDNRILCWNPNSNVESGEVLCELPTSNQWSFDVTWCPRNPAVIASSSCDGHVSVFSLMGGQQQVQCSSKIAESFPGSENFMQPPNVESIHRHISVPLKKPPKWVRKPVGASFGFGGKLVYFGNEVTNQSQMGEQIPSRYVHISQVITEPELLKKSEKLESSLANGNLLEFCQNRVENSSTDQEKITWNFLQATFNNAPRAKMLSLLGYDYEKVVNEINSSLKHHGRLLIENPELNDQVSNLNIGDGMPNGSIAFDNIAMKAKDEEEQVLIQTDSDISSEISETDGLISQALLTGNIASAVELCIEDNRWADALVLAQAGGLQLLQKTQKLYFKSNSTNSSKLISAVVTSDWHTMVKTCNLNCWKEMLAAILTYAKPEDFPSLCELLGNRLENNVQLKQNASLCYISAGNLERLAQSWVKVNEEIDVNSLQSLIEQVMILRRAVEQLSGTAPPLQTGVLSSLLGQYAELLATQGSLNSAITYLVDPNERTLAVLRDRIYQALGHRSPQFPFQHVDVRRSSTASSVHSQYGAQHQQPQQQSHVQPARKSFSSHTNQSQGEGGIDLPKPLSDVPGPMDVFQVKDFMGLIKEVFPTVVQHRQCLVLSHILQVILCLSINNLLYHPLYTPPSSNIMAPVTPPAPIAPPTADLPPPQQTLKSSSGSHVSQRYPRHLHDPSVYSENTYSSQQQFYQPQSFAASQPQMNAFSQQTNFYSAPGTSIPSASPYPPASGGPVYQPSYGFVPSSQAMAPLPSQSPAPASAQMPPPASETPQPLPSCYSEVKPGWNDPPLLKQAPAKSRSFENPTPITSPFPDAPAPEPQMPPYSQATNPGYFVPSYSQHPPATMNANAMPAPVAEEAKMVPPRVPEQPKEKGPIPPEHQVLQDIFEDLRRQCQQVATNPQTRRKLDDVAKKLENLYERLREGMLSGSITHGLHQIVQAIMQSDYQTALGVHGQLVATANFSEISGFMPSVKVLLQTASQLNVFLQ